MPFDDINSGRPVGYEHGPRQNTIPALPRRAISQADGARPCGQFHSDDEECGACYEAAVEPNVSRDPLPPESATEILRNSLQVLELSHRLDRRGIKHLAGRIGQALRILEEDIVL